MSAGRPPGTGPERDTSSLWVLPIDRFDSQMTRYGPADSCQRKTTKQTCTDSKQGGCSLSSRKRGHRVAPRARRRHPQARKEATGPHLRLSNAIGNKQKAATMKKAHGLCGQTESSITGGVIRVNKCAAAPSSTFDNEQICHLSLWVIVGIPCGTFQDPSNGR
jgi:hypothetical protein